MPALKGRVLSIVALQFVACQLLIAAVSSRSLQDDVGLNIDVNVIGERVIDENHNVIDYHLKNTAATSADDGSPNIYDYPSDSARSFTNFDYDSFERRSKSASSSRVSQLEPDSTASYRRGALGLAENIEEKQYGGTDAEKGQNYVLSIYPISQQQQQQQHLLLQPQQQVPISQYYPQQQQIGGVAAGPQDLYFNPPAMQIPYPFYHTSSTMAPTTTTTTTTTTTMATTTTRASDDSSSDDSDEKKKKRKRKRVRPSVIIVKKVLPLSTSTYASG